MIITTNNCTFFNHFDKITGLISGVLFIVISTISSCDRIPECGEVNALEFSLESPSLNFLEYLVNGIEDTDVQRTFLLKTSAIDNICLSRQGFLHVIVFVDSDSNFPGLLASIACHVIIGENKITIPVNTAINSFTKSLDANKSINLKEFFEDGPATIDHIDLEIVINAHGSVGQDINRLNSLINQIYLSFRYHEAQ